MVRQIGWTNFPLPTTLQRNRGTIVGHIGSGANPEVISQVFKGNSANPAQKNVLTYGASVAQSLALSGRTKIIVSNRKSYHNKNPDFFRVDNTLWQAIPQIHAAVGHPGSASLSPGCNMHFSRPWTAQIGH
jgi:hypothetical protein